MGCIQTKWLSSAVHPSRAWVKHKRPWKAALLSRKLKGNKPAQNGKLPKNERKTASRFVSTKGCCWLMEHNSREMQREVTPPTTGTCPPGDGMNLPDSLQQWHSSLHGEERFAPTGLYHLLLKNTVMLLTSINVLTQEKLFKLRIRRAVGQSTAACLIFLSFRVPVHIWNKFYSICNPHADTASLLFSVPRSCYEFIQ